MGILVMLIVGLAGAQERVISTIGQAEIQVRPDTVSISIGVESEAQDATQALATNSTKMERVLRVLGKAGVDSKNIQTSQFNIYSHRPYRRDGTQSKLMFKVSNQVKVTTKKMQMVGKLLSQVVGAGSNNIQQVQFFVSEKSKLLDEARTQAIADARRKAEVLARAAGAQLGSILQVIEQGATPPQIPTMRMSSKEMAAASVPIETGQSSLSVQVSTSWKLK